MSYPNSVKRMSRIARFDGHTRIVRARRSGGDWERVHGWVRLAPSDVRRLKQQQFSELELRRWGRRAHIPVLLLQRHFQ